MLGYSKSDSAPRNLALYSGAPDVRSLVSVHRIWYTVSSYCRGLKANEQIDKSSGVWEALARP